MTIDTIKLSKPLKTHTGEVNELVLKEPTARCFFDFDEPFTIRFREGKYEIEYRNAAMFNFIAHMANVDPIILKDLDGRDFMKARVAVSDYLIGLTGVDNPPTEQ